MLDIEQIQSFYPDYLKPFKRNLLREYLQYKILEAIFDSKFGDFLSFMGGTAIHIIHGNSRFSEDLDFDNLGLNKRDFEGMTGFIAERLGKEGYSVEIKNVFTGASTAYIKIIGVLQRYGISQNKEEKLLIKIDAEPQNFKYESEKIIINKFDVLTRIKVVPVDILLSQKLYAIIMRKRPMGRDFFDTLFLFGKTKPNMAYLRKKLKIKDAKELKKKLLQKCQKLDFKQLSKDTEQFLFIPEHSKKILLFNEYIEKAIF